MIEEVWSHSFPIEVMKFTVGLLVKKALFNVRHIDTKQVLASLIEATKEIKGSKVENNKFCVSVHYRNVDEKVKFLI